MIIVLFFLILAVIDVFLRQNLPVQVLLKHKFSELRFSLFVTFYFLFLAVFLISQFSKKFKELGFFFLLILIAAFPNLLELLLSKEVSNYFNLGLFYNNISDTLVTLAFLLLSAKLICNLNKYF